MSNVVSLVDYRAKKESVDLRANWVLGEPTGCICTYCSRPLRHAILEPHGIIGQGCEHCEVWFSGKDDIK
jgi:hypothetical protein